MKKGENIRADLRNGPNEKKHNWQSVEKRILRLHEMLYLELLTIEKKLREIDRKDNQEPPTTHAT